MPRIRTLKPEHRQHRKVGRLTDREYRLWVAMILEADDEGRLVEDPGALRLAAFGYQLKTTDGDVLAALDSIEAAGLIRRYIDERSSNRYIDFPSWHDHQRIDRSRPSLLPPYDASTSIRRTIVEPSTTPRADLIGSEGIGTDRKGRESARARGALVSAKQLPGFTAFWAAYPKRVGKDAALKAWQTKGCEALEAAVMAGLAKQGSFLGRDGGKYTPNPATWLNQGRWQDEPPANGHQRGFGTQDMSGLTAFLEAHKHDAH